MRVLQFLPTSYQMYIHLKKWSRMLMYSWGKLENPLKNLCNRSCLLRLANPLYQNN